MTWLDTRKGVSQSRTESSSHNSYDSEIVYVFILLTNTRITPFWCNVRSCACNVYQAAFPQEMRPGIEANISHNCKERTVLNTFIQCCKDVVQTPALLRAQI